MKHIKAVSTETVHTVELTQNEVDRIYALLGKASAEVYDLYKAFGEISTDKDWDPQW